VSSQPRSIRTSYVFGIDGGIILRGAGHRYKTEHALMRRKIFVGGIGPLGEREITNFFSKQGEVESVEVLRGRDKQPRGFSFVIFKRAETVQKLVAARFFEIGNRPVEVRV